MLLRESPHKIFLNNYGNLNHYKLQDQYKIIITYTLGPRHYCIMIHVNFKDQICLKLKRNSYNSTE